MNTFKKLKRRVQYLFLKRGFANKLRHTWLVWKCFEDMYSYAGVDFKTLVDNAPLNDIGQKDIPFDDYTITKKQFYGVLEFYQSFLKEKYYKDSLSNQVHLGCSPRHE